MRGLAVEMTPLVSVVMSVRNGEKYVSDAVESILNQSLQDFEFIIIDDDSTDRTAEILDTYSDSRIIRVKNEKNIKLAASLNKGIVIAQGEFIARMDADDISLPHRLSTQVAYLRENPGVTAVFTRIHLFSENGRSRRWIEDEVNLTSDQIRATLPYSNCLAHPTLLIRAQVCKKYLYDEDLSRSQDWDLWLRLISDNHLLAKIDQSLLRYRVHELSETRKSHNTTGLNKKIFDVRNQFLLKQAKLEKWGEIERQVFHNHLIFLISAFSLAELISLYPACFRIRPTHSVFLELVIIIRKINEGGAERVVTTWANEFVQRGQKVTILTDEKEASNDYPLLEQVGRVAIHEKKTYFEDFSKFVEKNQAETYIINDDYSVLCYKKMILLKLLGKQVIVANHGVWYIPAHPNNRWMDSWSSRVSIFRSMDAVVCLSLFDKAYWNWAGLKNVVYIHNPPPFQANAEGRAALENTLIIWIGRFSKEKQPELMIEIFAQVKKKMPSAKLCMLGHGALLEPCIEKAKRLGLSSSIAFPGFVKDVQNYLQDASVHCITSEYEGFPMSWLEAKAYGIPTVAFRLSNLEMASSPGSILVKKYDVDIFAENVTLLLNDPMARKKVGEEAFLSFAEFSRERAFNRWDSLFAFVSSQSNYDALLEKSPPEVLNGILFDQFERIIDDWMRYDDAKTLELDNDIKRIFGILFNIVLKRSKSLLKRYFSHFV